MAFVRSYPPQYNENRWIAPWSRCQFNTDLVNYQLLLGVRTDRYLLLLSGWSAYTSRWVWLLLYTFTYTRATTVSCPPWGFYTKSMKICSEVKEKGSWEVWRKYKFFSSNSRHFCPIHSNALTWLVKMRLSFNSPQLLYMYKEIMFISSNLIKFCVLWAKQAVDHRDNWWYINVAAWWNWWDDNWLTWKLVGEDYLWKSFLPVCLTLCMPFNICCVQLCF